MTFTAVVDDSTTGNSILASAEYQMTGGSWSPMLASDGSFDAPLEQVTAQFAAPQSAAQVEVCVSGSDVFGNTGSVSCELLEINAPAGPPPLYLPIAVKTFSAP